MELQKTDLAVPGQPKGNKRKRYNQALIADLNDVLRKHKVKYAKKHIDTLKGAGFLGDIAKKAVGVIKTGIKFYKDNKDTIHKVAGEVVKHAPAALDVIKKLKGGSAPQVAKSLSDPQGTAAEAVKKFLGGSKRRSNLTQKQEAYEHRNKEVFPERKAKKTLHPALHEHISKAKAYMQEHGCTYREALKAVGKHGK